MYQKKNWEEPKNKVWLRVPTDSLECQNFLAKHGLSLHKKSNYKTGIRNRKIGVPEIYDILIHETGVIAKVRDYEYLPDHRWQWIMCTNMSADCEEFQIAFHDYIDAKAAEEAARIKSKRGRKPLPPAKEVTIVTKIQLFDPKK